MHKLRFGWFEVRASTTGVSNSPSSRTSSYMDYRRHSRFRSRSRFIHDQEPVSSDSEPDATLASASPVALDFTALPDKNVAQSPGYLLPLSSAQSSSSSPQDRHARLQKAELSGLSATGTALDTSIDLWNEALHPGVSNDANLPVLEPSELLSQAPIDLAADDEALMFAGFPEADILEQYLNYTDTFDPSLTELLDVDLIPEPSSKPRDSQMLHDEAYVFKSPLAWVANWSVENLRGDPRYAEVVEQRVFNLPRISEILTLLRLYFSHAHHRLPVLNEHYFYILTGQRHGHSPERSPEPISLALLYAIMFAACTVSELRTVKPFHSC